MDNNKLTFISYSRVDQEFALRLAEELKSSGLKVWLDQTDIPKGARWDDEIERALKNCDVFMVILTPDSSSSQNVKDEIGTAVDGGKQIIPILYKESDIPFRLRRFQYVDFTKMNFHEGLEEVKALLDGRIVKVPPPPPLPPPNWLDDLLRKLSSTRGIHSIVALIVFACMGTLTWSLSEIRNPFSISKATITPTISPTMSPTALATETEPVILVETTLPKDTLTVEPSAPPLFTPPVTPYVHIQDISFDDDRNYVVDYETYGYVEMLPGMHVHFFFNVFARETVGVKGTGDSIGGGKWNLYGGPWPIRGYSVEDKMSQFNTATQMCALVANPDHSILLGSGDCMDLPESP